MTAPFLTFERLHDATRGLSGPERLRFFDNLTDARQADCWGKLHEQLLGERILDALLVGPLAPKQSRQRRSSTNRGFPRFPRDLRDDVLDTIPPSEYVEALTGESVPHSGVIRCPLPGHDDRTPSFQVYRDPGRGWYCFGCHRGGSAIDLASYLTGIEPRGDGYQEIRRIIAENLLGVNA
jgi:hypothetical protein